MIPWTDQTLDLLLIFTFYYKYLKYKRVLLAINHNKSFTSNDIATGSEITPCNKIDKQLAIETLWRP